MVQGVKIWCKFILKVLEVVSCISLTRAPGGLASALTFKGFSRQSRCWKSLVLCRCKSLRAYSWNWGDYAQGSKTSSVILGSIHHIYVLSLVKLAYVTINFVSHLSLIVKDRMERNYSVNARLGHEFGRMRDGAAHESYAEGPCETLQGDPLWGQLNYGSRILCTVLLVVLSVWSSWNRTKPSCSSSKVYYNQARIIEHGSSKPPVQISNERGHPVGGGGWLQSY